MVKVQLVRPVLPWRRRSTSRKFTTVDQLIDRAVDVARMRSADGVLVARLSSGSDDHA